MLTDEQLQDIENLVHDHNRSVPAIIVRGLISRLRTAEAQVARRVCERCGGAVASDGD